MVHPAVVCYADTIGVTGTKMNGSNGNKGNLFDVEIIFQLEVCRNIAIISDRLRILNNCENFISHELRAWISNRNSNANSLFFGI